MRKVTAAALLLVFISCDGARAASVSPGVHVHVSSLASGHSPNRLQGLSAGRLRLRGGCNGVAALEERMKALINQAPVMLFMKGEPDAPQCGFSRWGLCILQWCWGRETRSSCCCHALFFRQLGLTLEPYPGQSCTCSTSTVLSLTILTFWKMKRCARASRNSATGPRIHRFHKRPADLTCKCQQAILHPILSLAATRMTGLCAWRAAGWSRRFEGAC